MKGLEKLKKAELINIILRKDDVDKSKNAQIDELGTKLSASEQLIEELRTNSVKFKNEKDGVNRRLAEANTTIKSLIHDRDALIGKSMKLENKVCELTDEIITLKDKGKVNKVFGIAGCILAVVAIAILLIF